MKLTLVLARRPAAKRRRSADRDAAALAALLGDEFWLCGRGASDEARFAALLGDEFWLRPLRSERAHAQQRAAAAAERAARPTTAFRIVSGGEAGAERAALCAARAANVSTAGAAPPRFRTEAGFDLALRDSFGLVADPDGAPEDDAARLARASRNVDAADATVVFALHEARGLRAIADYCRAGPGRRARPPARKRPRAAAARPHRPCLIVSALGNDVVAARAASSLLRFLQLFDVRALNVVGHATAGARRHADYAARVQACLEAALASHVPTLRPPPS